MNILYLLPGEGMSNDEIKRRDSIANSLTSSDIKVTVMEVGKGALSIESAVEEYMSIGPMLRKLVDIRKEKQYAAIIIGCAGDPGLSAARELMDIPVIGPAESSIHFACMISDRFSILTVLQAGIESQDSTRILVREKGLESRLASIEFVQMPIVDMWGTNRDAIIDQMVDGVLKAKQNGAGCIVLGCMSLAFLMLDDIIEKRTDIPIVNPLKTSIKTAEAFIDLNLMHSRITYPEADLAKLNTTVFDH